MNDYESIQATLFEYFDGYTSKDRKKLENAFELSVANMIGYWKTEGGDFELFSKPITELIDKWTDPDFEPFEFGDRKILSLHIFSDVGATAVFDCGGRFIDTFQLVKRNGAWRIANKFFVDQ